MDFDTTRNLFIEGDNLDALKLLQENYFGRVKWVYMDPPYNTGNDMIYDDDFAESARDGAIYVSCSPLASRSVCRISSRDNIVQPSVGFMLSLSLAGHRCLQIVMLESRCHAINLHCSNPDTSRTCIMTKPPC